MIVPIFKNGRLSDIHFSDGGSSHQPETFLRSGHTGWTSKMHGIALAGQFINVMLSPLGVCRLLLHPGKANKFSTGVARADHGIPTSEAAKE